MTSRSDPGWRYGSVGDHDRLLHPAILPYEAPSEADKESRHTARMRFGLLASQNLIPVRADAPASERACDRP